MRLKFMLPPNMKNLSDGQGGVYNDGDISDVPDDAAKTFLEMKVATPAGEPQRSLEDAKRAMDEKYTAIAAEEQAGRSRAAMAQFDSLSAEEREAFRNGTPKEQEAIVRNSKTARYVDGSGTLVNLEDPEWVNKIDEGPQAASSEMPGETPTEEGAAPVARRRGRPPKQPVQ